MQMVKIQIPDQPNRALATLEISRRGRMDSYPDHVYMVPEPALDLLKQHEVAYTELGRGGGSTMRKRRYEILLPLTHNDGRCVDPAMHEKTHEELVARFGALSHLPASVRGIWVNDGQRQEEEFIRLFVDVSDTQANRKFFVRLKATLLERFEQLEIYIASYPVDVL